MKKWTKTESAIADYLYNMGLANVLPVTKNAPEVEWIYTFINGSEYGITNAMAQTIMIISERIGENGEGGTLKPLRGNGFAFEKDFAFSESGERFIRV